MINNLRQRFNSLSETKRTLLFVFGAILATIALAVGIAAIAFPHEKVVGNLGMYYLRSLPGFYFYTIGIRGLVGAAIAFVQSIVMLRVMNVHTWAELVEKFNLDSNTSHVTFVEAFIMGSMILAASAPLTSAYLLNVCFWGGAAILTALCIIVTALYIANIRTLEQYREWVDKPHNDNYAKIFRALYVGIMFLTMMAGK